MSLAYRSSSRSSFSRLSDQEDVGAELEDPVHVGQLFEHDGVRDPAEELTHELPDNQNH